MSDAGADREPGVPEPSVPGLRITDEQQPGVYADFVFLGANVHGFTLDFMRSNPHVPPPGEYILVSRIALSPILAQQLRDVLDDSLGRWTQSQMGSEP